MATAVKAGWLNVTLTNYRNTDALDGVLGAVTSRRYFLLLGPKECEHVCVDLVRIRGKR